VVAVLGQAHSVLTRVSVAVKAYLVVQHFVGVPTQLSVLLVLCVAWLFAEEAHDGAR
jgi:hypothetical protein